MRDANGKPKSDDEILDSPPVTLVCRACLMACCARSALNQLARGYSRPLEKKSTVSNGYIAQW